jgi:integrase
MSITKTKGLYYFDFWRGGHRFSGPTGATSKRGAIAVEQAEIAKAEVIVRAEREQGKKPMTINIAFGHYASDVGGDEAELVRLIGSPMRDDIVALIDPETPVHDLTNTMLTEVQKKRRAQMKRIGTDAKGRPMLKPISNTTVNRTMEVFRAAIRHVTDRYDANVRALKWPMLDEPAGETPREATFDEEAKLVDTIRDDYAPIFKFSILAGLRKRRALLTWSQVDWQNRVIRYLAKNRKGKQEQKTMPLTAAIEAILRPLVGHHAVHVFTYVATGHHGGKVQGERAKGRRYPITYWGLQSRWQRAKKEAGIASLRWHDLRHTAASRLTRQARDLSITQELMGHADIKTTRKYRHVLKTELTAALEATAAANEAALAAASQSQTGAADDTESQTKSQTRGKLKVVG